MKFLLPILATASAFFISCERHEFEGKNGTKQLHEAHGAHHPDHANSAPPEAEHDADAKTDAKTDAK
ncbi:MAG: hypothetical protein WCJ66_16280 [Verrucomicrobiota bacterium]